MPTVIIVRGFRFYFFSNENNEPVHIHVEKGNASAKWWMNPILENYSYGFSPKDRKVIKGIITEHKDTIKNKWNEHFR
jgi:hypothetical protein